MFKGLKNLFRGIYSPRALKNSFIVNYHKYLQMEDDEIAKYAKSQSDNVYETVLNDVDKYLEIIGRKETRIEQVRELRRAILEYLEERIQSQIYFDSKWTEAQRKRIGKHLLPEIEEDKIPHQEHNIYIIASIAFFVLTLVSLETYKDKNSWVNDYMEIFRSYAELGVGISLEDEPLVRESQSRLREPMLNTLLEWQIENVYGS